MTKFLRSHPWLTLTVSLALIAFGSWPLYFEDYDLDTTAGAVMPMVGFLSFCVGLVGIMILIFRPIEFTRKDAAIWEVTRVRGKRRFIGRALLGSLPFLVILFVTLRSDVIADKGAVLVLLFLGLAILAAHQFWKYFEYQHDLAEKHAHGNDGENAKEQ